MTAAPEAFLAREAEMCYAVMAHVTDFDVWHISEETVSAQVVIQVLNRNTGVARQAIRNLLHSLSPECSCDCRNSMSTAFITDPGAIPPETRKKLDLLVRKYLK
jgi:5'-methylthioadenosine phosphorylase